MCTQGPHAFNQSAFMLTRSTALLLAAIEYEYYGVYTTSAQRSEIQGPMPVSLPSSGPGPEGGDDDGGGSDDDERQHHDGLCHGLYVDGPWHVLRLHRLLRPVAELDAQQGL